MGTMTMEQMRVPSKTTLRKYGLSEQEWTDILHSQGDVCAICKKVPTSGRFVTDHYHVRGFKKMPPEEKKKFVRGVCCTHCNRFYLAKGMTIEKAHNLEIYLRMYEGRKTK
jgi:hypothetical protein